jgi:hypothetical protein
MARAGGRAADLLAVIIIGILCFGCVFAAAFFATFRIWVSHGDVGSPKSPTILWRIPTVAG